MLHKFGVLIVVLVATNVAITYGQETSGTDDGDYDLASVPEMYGDFFASNSFDFDSSILTTTGFVNFPQRGRAKIGENNSVLPRDRFYFLYQHYNGAIESAIQPSPGVINRRSLSLSQYTLGVEKTSPNGIWSAEIRIPLLGSSDTQYDNNVFNSNGKAGNLSVVTKCLLYESATTAVSTGLGLTFPTGDDSKIDIGGEMFRVANDVVNLQPFLGVLRAGDRAFFQGFAQLDIPTSRNPVTAQFVGLDPEDLGKLKDQTLLFLDASAGYWLLRNREASVLTGLAGIAELHYTAQLGGAGAVAGLTDAFTTFTFGPKTNPLGVLTITSGLHCELMQRTALRIAAVVPLVNENARVFDSEIWASLNCRF